jgi:hypothetical protein
MVLRRLTESFLGSGGIVFISGESRRRSFQFVELSGKQRQETGIGFDRSSAQELKEVVGPPSDTNCRHPCGGSGLNDETKNQ